MAFITTPQFSAVTRSPRRRPRIGAALRSQFTSFLLPSLALGEQQKAEEKGREFESTEAEKLRTFNLAETAKSRAFDIEQANILRTSQEGLQARDIAARKDVASRAEVVASDQARVDKYFNIGKLALGAGSLAKETGLLQAGGQALTGIGKGIFDFFKNIKF